MDEPTVGLDPNQIIEMRTLIKNLGKHHTVILSSHILPEVEAVCDRIVIINNGRIVADDTAADLSAHYSSDHRQLARIAGGEKEVSMLLRGVSTIADFTPLGEKENGVYEYMLEPMDGSDFRRELFNALAKAGYPLLGLKSMELTLEEIFISLTREQLPEATRKGGKHQ